MGTTTAKAASRQSRHQTAALGVPSLGRTAATASGRNVAFRGIRGAFMLNAMVLLAALALLLAWGGREVQAPWGETRGEVFSQAQVAEWSQQIVDEQVTALGCGTTPSLTERVAVRNAVGFDRGVVRLVPFDEGLALGQAGEVFVVGWCA